MEQKKFEIVPIAQLQTGLYITGKLVGEARAVELKAKDGRPYTKYVHELIVQDAHEKLKFVEKKEDKSYGEASVEEGGKVSVWATKALHEMLSMFPEGTSVTISEDGEEAAGKSFKRRKFLVKMNKA
jgi:hypothetical protein